MDHLVQLYLFKLQMVKSTATSILVAYYVTRLPIRCILNIFLCSLLEIWHLINIFLHFLMKYIFFIISLITPGGMVVEAPLMTL